MKRYTCRLFVRALIVFVAVAVMAAAAADTPFLGLGDSLGEGVQSADASWRTQRCGYLNLLGARMASPFRLPWIGTSVIGVVGSAQGRWRMLPDVPGDNLAVSGATVRSVLYDLADADRPAQIESETDLVLYPRRGSQMDIAEARRARLISCWIGNNDVLSAALDFTQLDASQMTPVDRFSADLADLLDRLVQAGDHVVVGTIPDVTSIAFLCDREDLRTFAGSDFGLPDGTYTSLPVMLLLRLGYGGSELLLNPDLVLDADEVAAIQARTEIFNQLIQEGAHARGIVVVDMHAFFAAVMAQPPVFAGVSLTRRFLGGFFSLDGVHPSNIGHALVANEFIRVLNQELSLGLAPIGEAEMLEIFEDDPFVDKDGDGWVRGRPAAGLLETLAPVLGFSGDRDEGAAAPRTRRLTKMDRQRFARRCRELLGDEFRQLGDESAGEALRVFERIFAGLTVRDGDGRE